MFELSLGKEYRHPQVVSSTVQSGSSKYKYLRIPKVNSNTELESLLYYDKNTHKKLLLLYYENLSPIKAVNDFTVNGFS